VIIVFVIAMAALIAYSTSRATDANYKVKICMAFNGQTACKVASAVSEAGALRTGTEGACADIASGVTETVNCQNAAPQSVSWLKRP
jgi:hypothetical protein